MENNTPPLPGSPAAIALGCICTLVDGKETKDWLCPIHSWVLALDPEVKARALLEAKIEILTEEAVATSAIEGITIDPKVARRAVLRQMARRAGLL